MQELRPQIDQLGLMTFEFFVCLPDFAEEETHIQIKTAVQAFLVLIKGI